MKQTDEMKPTTEEMTQAAAEPAAEPAAAGQPAEKPCGMIPRTICLFTCTSKAITLSPSASLARTSPSVQAKRASCSGCGRPTPPQ